jgi:hypothetical protein
VARERLENLVKARLERHERRKADSEAGQMSRKHVVLRARQVGIVGMLIRLCLQVPSCGLDIEERIRTFAIWPDWEKVGCVGVVDDSLNLGVVLSSELLRILRIVTLHHEQ